MILLLFLACIFLIFILAIILTRTYCNQIPIVRTFAGANVGPTLFFLGGSHGNEPAGSFALKQLIKDIDEHKINLIRGKLIILPIANRCGTTLNRRDITFTGDLNRMYPYIHSNSNLNYHPKSNPIAKTIINLVNSSDFILDIHEGWSYRKANSESMGSTIASINMNLDTVEDLANKLNSKISDPDKKFMIMTTEQSYKTPPKNLDLYTFYTVVAGSLTDYCDSIGKSHILLETTGQNNIQPLTLRIQQCYTVIMHILNYYNLIERS